MPQIGVQVGSPRASVLRKNDPEVQLGGDGKATTLAAGQAVVGAASGVDGDGLLIDGLQDETTKLHRRAALAMAGDGRLRAGPSAVRSSAGGMTVAAWVKLVPGSTGFANVLGSSIDLGDGNWESAAGTSAQFALAGQRPGHREACFTSRPGDASLTISCGGEPIDDIDAYWGDASEQFLPNNALAKPVDICHQWRRVARTGVCQDQGIAERLRSACAGKATCEPTADVVGSNPCAGVAGSRPRLLVRALCRTAPVGMSLFVEGINGAATCSGAKCAVGPNQRLVLQVPNAGTRPPGFYESNPFAASTEELAVRSAGPVPASAWFHVAVTFRPDLSGADDDRSLPANGWFVVYLDGKEAARGFGRAPATAGWQWGRGYLQGMQGNWPNVWGSKYAPADKWGVDTIANAVSQAQFDDLFAYDHALDSPEIAQLANRTVTHTLRVFPPVAARDVAADQMWTSGGTVERVPVELSWLRDPSACAVAASASGLVRAPFDGLRVAKGATLAMPADGADLDDLKQWRLMAWLRVNDLSAGAVLLDVREGSASRVRLELTAACNGRGLRAVFADGESVNLPNCDHVLAKDQWQQVVVAQYADKRALTLDAAGVGLANGSGPLFAKSAKPGARRVVATAAADLGFAALSAGVGPPIPGVDPTRQFAAATRSSGPMLWMGLAPAAKSGDVATMDIAQLRNNRSDGSQDQFAAVDASGKPTTGPNWKSASVPLRGRLAPDAGKTLPPLTVAVTLSGAAGGAELFTRPLVQVGDGQSEWAAAAVCTGTWCSLQIRTRNALGSVAYWSAGQVHSGKQINAFQLAWSITDLPTTAATIIDGKVGNSNFAQISAATVSPWAKAFPPLLPAGSAKLIVFNDNTAGVLMTLGARVWYGAGTEDTVVATQASSCAVSNFAQTCAAQHRTCTDIDSAGVGVPTFGICGDCAAGYGDILGACVAQKGPMDACTHNAQCSSGVCRGSVCMWAGAESKVAAAKFCGLLGHDSAPIADASTNDKTAYGCLWHKCLPDFALQTDKFESGGKPGLEHMPVCAWSPTVAPADHCVRGTQCKGTGVCTGVDEPLYQVDPGQAAKTKLAAAPWIYTNNVWGTDVGPNWTCQTAANQDCATAVPKTGAVGRCLMPTGSAICKTLNRQTIAASGVDYVGDSHSGGQCSGCLADTLGSGANQKPVYVLQRGWLAPKACATIVNRYSAKTDWWPLVAPPSVFVNDSLTVATPKVAYDKGKEVGCSLADAAGKFVLAGVTRQSGEQIAAFVAKGQGDAAHFKVGAEPPNQHWQQNPWLGGYGHQVDDTLYLQRTKLDQRQSAQQWVGGQGAKIQCFSGQDFHYNYNNQDVVGWNLFRVNFVASDILAATPNLRVLGYLLGIDGLPASTDKLTLAQLKALRDAGVGPKLFETLHSNELSAEADKVHFALEECFQESHKQFKSSGIGKAIWPDQDVLSRYYDTDANRARCVYNKQPNGTTCPYSGKVDAATGIPLDDRLAADSLCESSYCSYDTGTCADAQTEVEAVSGKAVSKQSSNLKDGEIGPFRYEEISESALRFGAYPKQTIFQSMKWPLGTLAELETPTTAGALTDRRHLQLRAMLKADAFIPIPNSFQELAGMSEFDLNLIDFDLGYVIAPGHKIKRKKVRFVLRTALMGVTIFSDLAKPSVGEPCQKGSPKSCGYNAAEQQAVLTCDDATKKWTFVAGDKVCDGALPACRVQDVDVPVMGVPVPVTTLYLCVPKLVKVDAACSNQVEDGEYVPPSSAKNACSLKGSDTAVATGGASQDFVVPRDTGFDLLDFKLPILGGECTVELQAKALATTGPKPFWTQGLGYNGGKDFAQCLDNANGKWEKLKCIKILVDLFSDAPGAPPTKFCFRASPVVIGPLPLTFLMEAGPVLRFKTGLMVDDKTFEPSVYIRPSLGLEVNAVAKFDLKEVVGAKPLMATIQKKAPFLASFLQSVSDLITAQVGVEGELAVVELAFPVKWSVAMVAAHRAASQTVKFYGDNLNQGDLIPDLWLLQRKFTVDFELTLLRLSLKLFYKFGLAGTSILQPWIENEMEFFNFSGWVFNWKLADQVLQQWKADFGWSGPKF